MLDWARWVGLTTIFAVVLGGVLLWAFQDQLLLRQSQWSDPNCPESTSKQDTKTDYDLAKTQNGMTAKKDVKTAQSDQAPNATDENLKHKYECLVAKYTGQLVSVTRLLAFVTAILILVGLFQGSVMWKTIEHMRLSERAHVSGGANWRRRDDGSIIDLVVTINNYGKTRATIGTVAATICDQTELDSFLGWEVSNWPDHPFVKEWKGYVFGQTAGRQIDVVFPFEAGKVIAGRIWFTDIFKKQYSIGFLLKTDDLTAVGGRKSFWEEREEKDPSE